MGVLVGVALGGTEVLVTVGGLDVAVVVAVAGGGNTAVAEGCVAVEGSCVAVTTRTTGVA
jgi:hypothetical protein